MTDLTNFDKKLTRAVLKNTAPKRNFNAVLLFICFIGLLALLTSTNASAATCKQFSHSATDNSVSYDVYYSQPLTLETCNESVVLTASEYAVFKVYEEQVVTGVEITAGDASIAFTFGLSAYLTFWFIGYKTRMAKQAVKLV